MNKMIASVGMNLLVLMFVLLSSALSAQNCRLCEAVEENNFKRVEKIFRDKLLERKYGDSVNNGSAIYTTYSNVYDYLIVWLMQKECVTIAAWDKCQIKIIPYPNHVALGAIFKTQNNPVEMTFHIRQGNANRLKHLFNASERLYYLSMEKSNGFVKNQISLCNLEREPIAAHASLPVKDSLKHKNIAPSLIQKFNNTIEYKSIIGQYVSIDYNDTLIFKEYGSPATFIKMTHSAMPEAVFYTFTIVSEGKINQIGIYSPWRIQIVGIRRLQNGDIEAHFSGSYSFEENTTTKLIYRKVVIE